MLLKLLANENFPLASVKKLRELGYDIVSIAENSPGISDLQVLEKACIEKRIILTFDRDYGELIYKQHFPCPNGVIYFRMVPRYPAEPAELLLLFFNLKSLEFIGKFSIIEREKMRQRYLP